MAGGPQLPRLSAAAEGALAMHEAGRIPGEVALMRLMLAGLRAAELPVRLAHRRALAALAQRHAAGLARLERMILTGSDHAAGTPPEATRRMSDQLVAISPESAVAAYSLGDPATLARATQEVIAWLRREGLLAGAGVAAGMMAEVARVLRPGGRCVILNLAHGEADPAALAAAAGLVLEQAVARPFALWDGEVVRLRRPGLEAPGGL